MDLDGIRMKLVEIRETIDMAETVLEYKEDANIQNKCLHKTALHVNNV